MATVAKRFVGDGGERARSLQREEDGDFAKKTRLPLSFLFLNSLIETAVFSI